MKKLLRPAFVATSCVALGGCAHEYRNPPRPEPPKTASSENVETPTAPEASVPPRDAEGRIVFRKAAGTCYVKASKAGPPPPDLMSGETWTEEKTVACPKEFDDPAFAAIPDGSYWVRDEKTGQCSQERAFGNPPPVPVVVPCPPVLQKKK